MANLSIEIRKRFKSLINEGDGETENHKILEETKTKEKFNNQLKISGKRQTRGFHDKQLI